MKFTNTIITVAALAGSVVAGPGYCRPLSSITAYAEAPSPNTAEAFGAYDYYDNVAKSAVDPVNFEAFLKAGHAAVRSDESYITYKALSAYDVGSCAKACDASKECASFNIYFQRHPTVIPGPKCPNPDASVVVHCALFRSPMKAAQVTNYGQVRGPADAEGERFEVLMRGSNAYNRIVSPSDHVTVTSTVTAITTATVTATVHA